MSYCGTEIVKVLSGITYRQAGLSSDDNYGSFLAGTLIPYAEQLIDSYCHHDFSSHTGGTVTVDGTGQKYVVVKPEYTPLLSLTNISIDGSAKTASDFKVYDQTVVYDNGTFTEDEQNVILVVNYGYASVPDDVAYVCAQLCANMLRETVRSKMMPDLIVPTLEREGAGLTTLLRTPNIFTSELKTTLNQYVRYEYGVG